MAGSSKTNRKEGNVPVEHECPLNLLPRDIWCPFFYLDWPERRFIDRCVEAGNADAILRQGLTEYFWIARRGIGMELLSKAWTEGSVEVGYLSAMLLLCDHENEEEMQRGVEMLESIRTFGDVERCREFFADIFWERWVDERPSDLGHAVACTSTTCTTRGTMACVNDVSRILCVHCLANYEVRILLKMFRF
ncbi:uncharacterized protein [Arachis hypogaea]|uniref:At2g35280-like TPR domain-containing protein n=1 Tax=Arachis hypogaea TaxID=3818 RepID=A0A444X983_ARAHY|nr:uncharacterized protein LOC112786488 [Arachis hypogaea]RYQ86123.1 hypothetical protein Ahy_B10g105803 [Arachis hypogaea]